MQKLKALLYYLIFWRLPNSRFCRPLSRLRLWYVSRVLKVAAPDPRSFFEEKIYLGDGTKVKIGRHCMINEHVFLQGAVIGNGVMIAPHAALLSRSHRFDRVDLPMIEQGETEERIPVIEDDVWIGRNALILPGVRIGRGSIVGAGAVVTCNVAPWSIVGGVPAQLIRRRGPEGLSGTSGAAVGRTSTFHPPAEVK